MSSLVMEIEDYELEAGKPQEISRRATYFLLMIGSGVDVEFSYKGSRIGGGPGLQGGDAVGPLSQPFDQVTLISATAQTVKVATSSDPVTITRLSGVVKVDGVVQTAPDYSRVQKGESFWTHRGRGSVSGQYSYSQIWNTATNTKNVIVTALYVESSAGALLEFSNVELTAANVNNVAESPAVSMKITGAQTTNNAILAKGGSSATNDVTSGGITQGLISNGWLDLAQPIVLAPGTGVSAKTRGVLEEVYLNGQMFEVKL